MALNPASPLARLLAAPVRPGTVQWIGVRPARRAALTECNGVLLDCRDGLAGDHYGGRTGGARQVSLIGAEDLAAIASYLGLDAVRPGQLRRNLVVSGLNLRALRDCQVQVGTAVLAVTGECHPCSRMEAILGQGGYNAVRGHGGITARVVTPGEVRRGDAVLRLD